MPIRFQFEVEMVVAVRVDENFKIVVVVNYRVTVGELAPHMGLQKGGAHVEIFGIPYHLCAGAQAGFALQWPLNVGEGFCPGCALPGWVIQQTIDFGGLLCRGANVLAGIEGNARGVKSLRYRPGK